MIEERKFEAVNRVTLMFGGFFRLGFDEQLTAKADLPLVFDSHSEERGQVIQFLSDIAVEQRHVAFSSAERQALCFHGHLLTMTPTPRTRSSLRPIRGSLPWP